MARRRLTPIEKINKEIQRLCYEYRCDCRDLKELSAEKGFPNNGAAYHRAREKLWKETYSWQVNVLYAKLHKLKQEGA